MPVGGGAILADRQIVLSQPTAGTFKAFTAVCTHQGCTVSSIDKGLISCPCHGSRFHLADGSVANGPATQPLAPVAIKVADGQISLA
ncbi:Rieske (2Fe-2S) protein [Catenulispora yoronensis]|uniref:Rieske (2Fe-2S) protein n=1 Tax=Catenulispora yoronensis TaxID=450799 RepID=UPI0031D045BB